MACLTCGSTTSSNGKWNNLPSQGKKKHPNATKSINDSETAQDVINILKEPSYIYEFAARKKEGDLFNLAVKALEQLEAREYLVKLMPESTIPPAVKVKTIANMLIKGKEDLKLDNPLPDSTTHETTDNEPKSKVLPFGGKIEDYTVEFVIDYFKSDLEAMKEFVKSNKNMKLGRANKLESVAKVILKVVNK